MHFFHLELRHQFINNHNEKFFQKIFFFCCLLYHILFSSFSHNFFYQDTFKYRNTNFFVSWKCDCLNNLMSLCISSHCTTFLCLLPVVYLFQIEGLTYQLTRLVFTFSKNYIHTITWHDKKTQQNITDKT